MLPEPLGPRQQPAVVDQRCLHPNGVEHRVAVRVQRSRRVAGLMRINTDYGGSQIYWNEPDGHQWELLTVSYARAPA